MSCANDQNLNHIMSIYIIVMLELITEHDNNEDSRQRKRQISNLIIESGGGVRLMPVPPDNKENKHKVLMGKAS